MEDIYTSNEQNENGLSKQVDIISQDNQEARAFLRERSLRLLSGIAGKICELHTIESTMVTGEFKGCDMNVQEFFIKNLETPIATIPNAIVRDKDIVKIVISNVTN